MPRWKTELRIESDVLIEVKRLIRFGNSFALILPKEWVTVYCGSVDGDYSVKVNINQDEITVAGYKPLGGEQ